VRRGSKLKEREREIVREAAWDIWKEKMSSRIYSGDISWRMEAREVRAKALGAERDRSSKKVEGGRKEDWHSTCKRETFCQGERKGRGGRDTGREKHRRGPKEKLRAALSRRRVIRAITSRKKGGLRGNERRGNGAENSVDTRKGRKEKGAYGAGTCNVSRHKGTLRNGDGWEPEGIILS